MTAINKNIKLYQSHKSLKRALRNVQKELNESNLRVNMMVEAAIEAIDADSAIDRKSYVDIQKDAVLKSFMDKFLDEISDFKRFPVTFIFELYKIHCYRYSNLAFEDKKRFKIGLLEYLEDRSKKDWTYKAEQLRWPLTMDVYLMPETLMGIDITNNFRNYDRSRGFIEKVGLRQ